jgi:hypothetical protein
VESRGQDQDNTRVTKHTHLDARAVPKVQPNSKHILPVEGEVHRGRQGRSLCGQLNDGVNNDLKKENERLKKLIEELTIANDSFKKVLEGRRST